MRTFVVLNDIQIPLQDKQVLGLVLKFVKDLRPDGVILNGDVADCYPISKYMHDPKYPYTLKDEVEQCHKLMTQLENVNEKYYLGGNHEDRLRKYIWNNAPALGLDDRLDFSKYFGLSDHGFKWKPWGGRVDLGRLIVTHGFSVRMHSGYSAKAHFERLGSSVLIGHTHRLGSHFKTDTHGTHAAYENGCLCSFDMGYVQYPNWQQGFSVVHVDTGGWFQVTQIPILGHKRFYFGKNKWEI